MSLSSLRVRSVLVLLLAVVPPLTLALWTVAEWRRHETADVRATALQLARHAAAIHGRLIHASRQMLVGLAESPIVTRGDPSLVSLHLEGCLRSHTDVLDVGMARADGVVLASVRAPSDLTDVGKMTFFRAATRSRRFAVGDYDIDRATGLGTVMVGYPVLDQDREIRHVLFAVVGLSWVRELAMEAPLPSAAVLAVLDEEGTIVVQQPAPHYSAGRPALRTPVLQTLLVGNTEGTGEETSADGLQRLFGFAPLLDHAPAEVTYVAVGVPLAAATSAADRMFNQTLAGFGLALVLAVVVAWLGNDLLFLRRVKAMVGTTERLRGGDLEARTGLPHGPDELNRLAAAFDEMAESLQRRDQDLRDQGERLARQERRFRSLIENASDGVVLFDAGATLQYVSPSTARILGFGRSELIGRIAYEFVHPDDAEHLKETFAQVVREPAAFLPARFRVRHQDGTWRWIESVKANMLADPAVQAIVANFRDITERIEVERALREAHDALERRVEERTAELTSANDDLQAEIADRAKVEQSLRKLSRAIEQAGDSVFVTNREGIIEYVNPSFEKLTGFVWEEAVGATPKLFNSGRHDRSFFQKMWNTLLAGDVFRTVFTNKTKDGRLYFEDQTITPLRDTQGHITHFVSTGRDITRRRRVEDALRRLNDRFEHEATRIANVVHDEAGQFLTTAHITLAELAAQSEPQIRDRLREVRHSLDRVEQQLRGLSHELHPGILDDLGLVDAVKFLAQSVGKRSGIAVTVDASRDLACGRLVETALYRLVQEGLTNMTKHARATRGTVILGRSPQQVWCSIRDDGLGFDVDAVERRRGDERGLGLAGVRDRVEAVGGVLRIVSSPGAGTELSATVPLES